MEWMNMAWRVRATVFVATLILTTVATLADGSRALPDYPTSEPLDIDFLDDASFAVRIGNNEWFHSGSIRAFADGHWLRLKQSASVKSSGSDVLGRYSCTNVSWVSDEGHLIHTSLKMYREKGIAVFAQQLPAGAAFTNASNPTLPSGRRVMDPGNYPPSVAFPSFTGGQLNSLGYVTWQSRMVNVEWGTNITHSPGGSNEPLIYGRGLQGLSTSGPVVLFDRNSFDSLVVAPMDNFKSVVHFVRNISGGSRVWETGVSSEIVELPRGFEHRTMLIARNGITAALNAWGSAIQLCHGTNRSRVGIDRNVEYLSYWTDNGAYYSASNWGEAGGGGSSVNETTFLTLAASLQSQQLLNAVHIWQLDDWWYLTSTPQGGPYSACVRNWSLSTSNFPSGLKRLSSSVKTPWLLYVPYWCPQNEFSSDFRWVMSSNPGNPQFIFAEPHPDDALRFYRMLFDYGIANGMAGFENDYLDYNFLSIPYLRKNYNAANKWLASMNDAALERKIPIQICMALPSDLMASVQFDSMTNYRASTDYGIAESQSYLQPYDYNINIGGSSLLGFALGLRPSKDSFWSHRPSNCRNTNPESDPSACGPRGSYSNPGANCELNAIIATMSTGPVGIADKAGDSNTTLLRRCMRADGRILQPDKPATAIDSMFLNKAGPDRESDLPTRSSPPGFVWTTFSTVGQHLWYYILSIDVTAAWNINGRDLYPMIHNTEEDKKTTESQSDEGWVLYSWFKNHTVNPCRNGSLALSSGCIITRISTAQDLPPIHNERPIMVENDTHKFDLLELAPIVNGWVFLGEVDRYVRVSADRFEDILFDEAGITVTMRGSLLESTAVTVLKPRTNDDWVIQEKHVTFESEIATLRFV